MNYFDPPLVAPMLIKRDPINGRLTHLQTDPHDPPQTLRLIEAMLATHLHGGSPSASAIVLSDSSTAAAAQVAAPLARLGGSTRWLSEVIEHWLEEVTRKNNLDSNTVTYTYAPALKVFRELISTDKQGSDFDETSRWDMRISEITPDVIDKFVETFWSFPDRRGKRKHADAKEILADGGTAQTRTNALKNFGYVRMFVRWAAKRQELDSLARDRLEASLEGMKPLDRGHREEQALSPDDENDQGSGYFAFTRDELKRLFQGPTFIAYAAGDAARYWIALLGLFAGLRIGEASQLRPRDFKQLDGIWCVVVTPSKLNKTAQRADAGKLQRVKTPAGRRTVPVHPMLIKLGLLDFVTEKTSAGANWMFDLPWYPKSGFGHYPTRDFPRLSKAVGVHQTKRKVHHSFRSTLSQELEEQGLVDTLVDRVLGHKVRTVRAKHYHRNSEGRTLPVRAVFEALCKVDFDVSIPAWKVVRDAARRHLNKIALPLAK